MGLQGPPAPAPRTPRHSRLPCSHILRGRDAKLCSDMPVEGQSSPECGFAQAGCTDAGKCLGRSGCGPVSLNALDTWRRQHAVPLLKSPDSARRPLGKNIPPPHPGAGNRVTTCKEPVTHISLLLASNLIPIRQEGPCPQGVGRQGLSSAGAAGRQSAGTRGGEGWSRREHSEENAQKNVRERSAESLRCTPETKAAP